MIYEFSYRIEEDITDAIKEIGIDYPNVMEYVDCLSFETDKTTLEEAIIDFLLQDLGTIWDIDPDVRVGSVFNYQYVNIEAIQDYDKSWTINGLNKYSQIKLNNE